MIDSIKRWFTKEPPPVQLELPLPQPCTCDGCKHRERELLDGTCGVDDCIICDPIERDWDDIGDDSEDDL